MSSAAGRKNPLTTPPPLNTMKTPSWWVTVPGRNFVGIAAGIGAGAYFGGYAILHTYFLDRYQKIVQLHKYGFPTNLPEEVKSRCKETISEMNLKMKNNDMARFFCVFGMDMFRAGSIHFRGGSIVGVPRCFTYRTAEDIEKNDIMVENKPVEWGSDGGQMLQSSLLLSERAQKFAIARELAMNDTYLPYVYGGIGAVAITKYAVLTRTLNTKLYGLVRPMSFRVAMYSLVGLFTYGVWATVEDFATRHYENYADKRAASVSLEYAKGGVEYYSKILQRNMALRSLMGPSGEKRFTFYGNDTELIRQRHVPYSERKANLEKMAGELLTSNSKEDENNN